MSLVAAAAIGAGSRLLGNRQQGKQQKEEAEANRAFQEEMSSSAYQRGTKDMQAAGLNPMLAYSQGGASSPGGSMASVPNMAEGVLGDALSALNADSEARAAGAVADQEEAKVDFVKNQSEATKVGTDETRADISLKKTLSEEAKFRAEREKLALEQDRIKKGLYKEAEPAVRAVSQSIKSAKDVPRLIRGIRSDNLKYEEGTRAFKRIQEEHEMRARRDRWRQTGK